MAHQPPLLQRLKPSIERSREAQVGEAADDPLAPLIVRGLVLPLAPGTREAAVEAHPAADELEALPLAPQPRPVVERPPHVLEKEAAHHARFGTLLARLIRGN
jgi:hypothetical protein